MTTLLTTIIFLLFALYVIGFIFRIFTPIVTALFSLIGSLLLFALQVLVVLSITLVISFYSGLVAIGFLLFVMAYRLFS